MRKYRDMHNYASCFMHHALCIMLYASCFFFGHLWHASRAVFQDIWTGVSIESFVVVEYGRNEKLGDKTTKASTFL